MPGESVNGKQDSLHFDKCHWDLHWCISSANMPSHPALKGSHCFQFYHLSRKCRPACYHIHDLRDYNSFEGTLLKGISDPIHEERTSRAQLILVKG